ncbi:L-threonylcarbamoyladenylate synthase [Dissulfuribacter thermophilus]|nr:L-threonylcarbamoyladenylate synthase [Dissulfuribacter thermophilus]
MTSLIGTSIKKAARIIRDGGVVAFPTETSYGLGASIYHSEALKTIYDLKERPEEKPLLVLISRLDDLKKVTERIPDEARAMIERFWPGPLTILFDALPGLDNRLKNPQGKIAVRLTSHPIARELIEASGIPITGTSANPSGAPPARSPQEVLGNLKSNLLVYILDGGVLPLSPPSTIVDPSTSPPTVLREGVIKTEDILS